jgi:hypothetical protein
MAPASPQREQVMKLVLVRHGETDLNRSCIIQGRLDTNLNQFVPTKPPSRLPVICPKEPSQRSSISVVRIFGPTMAVGSWSTFGSRL